MHPLNPPPVSAPAWDTRGGEEFSWRGPNFETMSNSFKLCPTHFSKGAKKCLVWASPPSYGPD